MDNVQIECPHRVRNKRNKDKKTKPRPRRKRRFKKTLTNSKIRTYSLMKSFAMKPGYTGNSCGRKSNDFVGRAK